MSDNEEMMQTKNSSLEDSSGDESSSEAAVNNQKFSSRDGEPVNKPRKVGYLFIIMKFLKYLCKKGFDLHQELSSDLCLEIGICYDKQTAEI